MKYIITNMNLMNIKHIKQIAFKISCISHFTEYMILYDL